MLSMSARFKRTYCRCILFNKVFFSSVHSFVSALYVIVVSFCSVVQLFIFLIDASPGTGVEMPWYVVRMLYCIFLCFIAVPTYDTA